MGRKKTDDEDLEDLELEQELERDGDDEPEPEPEIPPPAQLAAKIDGDLERPGPGEKGWKPQAGDVIPPLECDVCEKPMASGLDREFRGLDEVAIEQGDVSIRCTRCQKTKTRAGPRYAAA